MKICDNFILVRRDGKNYVESENPKVCNLQSSVSLNETAAFLFKKLKEAPRTKEELLSILLENFEISTVLALNDIDIFVKTLKRNGIVEE